MESYPNTFIYLIYLTGYLASHGNIINDELEAYGMKQCDTICGTVRSQYFHGWGAEYHSAAIATTDLGVEI